MIPLAAYPIRRAAYDLFRVMHILLAVFVVIGCYYHIICRFQRQWGYESWIYVAIPIWVFERVMRVARVARNGIKTATVIVIDEDYVRVEIDGISGTGHAYLYFPTLTWKVWENHPFSVANATISHPADQGGRSDHNDIEKSGAIATTTSKDSASGNSSESTQPAKVGLTFLLRCREGLTSKIRSRATLPVLVEAGYGQHEDTLNAPSLLCVAGGVGITACIPYLRSHPGRVKLLWGVRTSGLVKDCESMLAGIDKDVFVGKRMNVKEELERQLSKSEMTIVVSSGPHGMADEVRCEIARMARIGYKVRLVEEAFSW